MIADAKPLSEINRKAIDILTRELGVADMLRFFQQFSVGAGDYTEERDALFAGMSPEQMLAEIREIEKAEKK